MQRDNLEPSGDQHIEACLKKLDLIDESFPTHPQTLELLFQSGLLTGREIIAAGDFDLVTWSHSSDGSFSVGALEKNRFEGKPFPRHEHTQRLWLLCSKGIATLNLDERKRVELKQGEYAVIEPLTPHVIQAKTQECVVLMVTIPADPGLERRHERNDPATD